MGRTPWNRIIPYGCRAVIASTYSTASPGLVSTYKMDAEGHRFAWRFFPWSTSPITHVDCMLRPIGDCSAWEMTYSIQSDDGGGRTNGKPSGTILGATNNAKATSGCVNGSPTLWWPGWTVGGAPLALAENTGALTLNQPYWFVCENTVAANAGASHYIYSYRYVMTRFYGWDLTRIDDGSGNYTHVTAGVNVAPMLMVNTDGEWDGLVSGTQTNLTDIPRIYGANFRGARYRIGGQYTIAMITARIGYAGTPSNLIVRVRVNGVTKTEEEIPRGYIAGTNPGMYTLPLQTAVDVPAWATVDILLFQKDGDGDTSNYWELNSHYGYGGDNAWNSNARWRYVYGTDQDAVSEYDLRVCPHVWIWYNPDTGLIGLPRSSGLVIAGG